MPSSDTQFKQGHTKSGGRKRGTRNKLTDAWIKDLYEVYQDVGKEKLKQAMEERSDVVMKHIAALVPKDVDVKHSGDVTINIVDYQDES